MSDLKPCPFCGGKPLDPEVSSGSDERCGYNFNVVVECGSCGVTVTTASKQDKAGWCIESPQDAITRAVELWNRRTQPETVDGDPIGDLQAESRQAKLDDFIASMKTQPEATAPAVEKLSLSIAVSIDYMKGWNDCVEAHDETRRKTC